MPQQKIKTILSCQNIAPIGNLNREISSSSLKFGVFANNGSGKTFISRMFRLTEKHEELTLDEDDNCQTDKLITLGEEEANFNFKIIDSHESIAEEFDINLNKHTIPEIPDTNYIFHVFNEDYVEDNLISLDYDKDDNIDGYILGKVNIDLTQDEEKLSNIEQEAGILSSQIEGKIIEHKVAKIDYILNIKRLNEYKELQFINILNSVDKDKYEISKSYDELIEDYNKIKSVPENLPDIELIKI